MPRNVTDSDPYLFTAHSRIQTEGARLGRTLFDLMVRRNIWATERREGCGADANATDIVSVDQASYQGKSSALFRYEVRQTHGSSL